MIFSLLSNLSFYEIPQNTVEIARVRRFVRDSHIGLHDILLPGYDAANGLPDKADAASREEFGVRDYSWNGTSVTVDAQMGFVVAYYEDSDRTALLPERAGLDPATVDRLAPRRVTDAQAATLGRRFHEAAGSPYGIQFNSIRDRQGERGNRLQLDFVPTWRGVPYDRGLGGYMEIGRDDGCLRWYLLHALASPLPRPPAVLAPRASLAAARLAALRIAAGRREGPVEESASWPLALCIATPAVRTSGGRRGGLFSFLRPAERARAAAGEGRLVYSGQVRCLMADGREDDPIDVRVDALTGRLLDLYDLAGGRGGRPDGVPKTLGVPTATRSWRVAEGDAAWSPPARAALTPIPSPAPATGGKVLLTDGRAAFPATYDAKANLIAIGGKGYRPGPALAALLRRTKG